MLLLFLFGLGRRLNSFWQFFLPRALLDWLCVQFSLNLLYFSLQLPAVFIFFLVRAGTGLFFVLFLEIGVLPQSFACH